MSEGCLLWHSRHCGRDTTGVLYKGPRTPSKKRAARLIRQALCINLGRIFAALSVRSWEIYRPSSSVGSWPGGDDPRHPCAWGLIMLKLESIRP
jgi:hypothetical protein